VSYDDPLTYSRHNVDQKPTKVNTVIASFFGEGNSYCKAAFTPAQHVARQQVARTSNMLQATLSRNMLRWCKRGLWQSK